MKKFACLSVLALAALACDGASTGPVAPVAPAGPNLDDIPNTIDGTVDATAEVMTLNVGGPAGTTTFYVVPLGGDGKPGCNLTGSTTLVINLASSAPAVATVSPSSMTFGSCGDVKTVTVTPVSAGTATISATQVSNNTGGTFNLGTATFKVNVAPPANTAPSVSIVGVTGGAIYDKGSVPAATCQVTDAEDGPSSFPATLSAVTGPNAADGLGSQTASCSYTDGGGLTASSSVTYSIVDPTAPGISYTLSPSVPDGQNGWYVSDITVDWTVSEPESPNSLVLTGCVDQTFSADGTHTFACGATSAGGSSTASGSVMRDATAPSISGSASTTAWTNQDVAVTFSCSDATSGVASCGPDATVSSEGANQSVSGSATDAAGNSASTTVGGINIDKTAPSVSLAGGPADGASYYFGSVPGAPTCSASDALSGVAGSCAVSGYGTTVGTHTVTASASDVAGNSGSASVTYTVLAWTLRGFYSPVNMAALNTVKGGSTVPLKFEIFAGPTEITSTDAVASFVTRWVSCEAASGIEDPVDVTSTGGTALRYDATAGQFIQNWQTGRYPGRCYRVTMTTDDGSTISADFKLK